MINLKLYEKCENVLLKMENARALICPGMGGNCISLQIGEADILRTPDCGEALCAAPNLYGIPILFPPNRIKGGCFYYSGRKYQFPINEPKRHNHIHGFLNQTCFSVQSLLDDETGKTLTLTYRASIDNPYMQYPHTFSATRTWHLTNDALYQKVSIRNDSDEPMPVGIGFHTTLNACFLPGDSCPEHYHLRMSATQEILYDPDRIIPTGEILENTKLLQELNGQGIVPQGERVSCHMKRGKNGAELIHVPSGQTICMTVSDSLPYWILWNSDGHSGFICPEAQSWMIDAPNQSQKYQESGFKVIAPDECFHVEMCFQMKHL